MVTDDQRQDKGFAARWETICGQNYQHETQGIVESGNYGFGNYSSDQNCIWNITGEEIGDLISFNFKSVAIESNCQNDYVALYKNNEIRSENLIGKTCGQNQPTETFRARGNLLINFVTNENVEDLGFRGEFNIEKCGQKYKDISGKISNYHYTDDKSDHANLNCTWQIEAQDPTLVVTLKKWTDFDIEYEASCAYDYVAIYDGPDTTARKIGQYCGRQPPRSA